MSDSPHLSSPPDSYEHHVLETPESDIGLGIFKDAWPRQNVLFRPLVRDSSSASVNFARPLELAPSVELGQIEVGGLDGNISSIPFVFGTSSQRLRRKAQVASPASSSSPFSSPSTLSPSTHSTSPALSDTSSSPFQYSSGDSLPATPDMKMRGALSPRPAGQVFESPCPVEFRPVSFLQPRPIDLRRSSMDGSDYESEDSDSEDFMDFLTAIPLPPAEKVQQNRSKQFANAVAKLTSPSLISLSLGKKSPATGENPSRHSTPAPPVYSNRRAMATTANIVLVDTDDVFDSRPTQRVAGPSSIAELHILRASINALALSAKPNPKSNAAKQIRRKAVPAYISSEGDYGSAFSLATEGLPSIAVSPRTSSLPFFSSPSPPLSSMKKSEAFGRTKFDMIETYATPTGSISDHSSDSETVYGYGHIRTKSTWSSSSSSTARSGSSSDRESIIRTPPASAYDSPSGSMFAVQQAASSRKQYTLEVASLRRHSTRDATSITFAVPPSRNRMNGSTDTPSKKSGFAMSFSAVSHKLRRKPAMKAVK